MVKTKIGIAIDEDLHANVKSTAPLRGMNLESAYDQALRTWLSQQPISKYDAANDVSHQKLEQIINGRDDEARQAVLAAIELAFRPLKSGKSGRRGEAIAD